MAQIMATMAAKTPNEMLETAIFLLYLFFLRYFLKKKTPSLRKNNREEVYGNRKTKREEAENIGKQWC